jgi:hypothetical protein
VVTLAVAVVGVGLASAQSPRIESGLAFLTDPATTPTSTPADTTPATQPSGDPTATTAPPATTPTLPPPPPQVTAIGDSVMLGAKGALETTIPGINVDAAVSRQFGNGIDRIRQLKDAGQLSPVVVVHLGTNGVITDGHMAAMQQLLADRQRVVFVNLKVPRSWEAGDNDMIQRWVPRFANAVLINWNGEGSLHPEFFYDDRFHLNNAGRARYAQLIAAQINP